jgi:exodeoxyribonuclease-3
MDRFTASGYVDVFRELHPEPDRYTWWSYQFNARANNIGWRIDYFFVSGDLAGDLASAEIHPEVMGSDHCPVSIDLA